ncbi:hypothetical protein [Streptomyces subrutilus]|uniref:Uncharacterized protein n=1 Tax=Streptomyces subrutilus TaxID=36818 RepID=A0A1E5PLB4_9ACTN|nr:hypothetical protein [Streptomyces subrutilus]OEJ30359.1 hypothetical protein BGK67_02405 [Streptomyces subrutilus]
MLERERLKAGVVGDFIHGNPAARPHKPRSDGARPASVSLPTDSRRSFRYLAAGDYWFDDERPGHHDGARGRRQP